MKKIKEEKGITLVALIITIVVLLILAMVAIGTLQESNIIGHAQNAVGSFNQAKVNEIDLLAQYEKEIEDNLPKQEETVWGYIENVSTGEKILCYIGEEKEVKVTSNKFKVEEIEPTGSGFAFNRKGIIKDITFEDTIGIYLMMAPNLEKVDLGNILPENYFLVGMDSKTLRELTGLNGVKVFENDTFASCKKLELIEFPITTTTIESSAFNSCTSLKNITIPASVTSIGENAFFRCTSLTEVTINKTKAEVEAEGGIGTDWIPESVTKIIYNDVTVTR